MARSASRSPVSTMSRAVSPLSLVGTPWAKPRTGSRQNARIWGRLDLNFALRCAKGGEGAIRRDGCRRGEEGEAIGLRFLVLGTGGQCTERGDEQQDTAHESLQKSGRSR